MLRLLESIKLIYTCYKLNELFNREVVLVEKSLLERKRSHVAEAFGRLFKASFGEGVLPPKVKELIAMCMSLAVNCPECAKGHAEQAIKNGATEDDIAEALGVALLFVGGPIFRRGKAIEEMLKGMG